jgi:hypothetical protein
MDRRLPPLAPLSTTTKPRQPRLSEVTGPKIQRPPPESPPTSDNAGLEIKGVPWAGHHRTAPYTDSARETIASWVRLRAAVKPDHSRAWLNLWSAETVREPMTRATFDRLLRTYVGEGGWTFRRLRATCIVNWIRAGLQLEDLRDALGYSNIAGLLPYARCVGGDAGREMDRLDGSFSESLGVVADAATARRGVREGARGYTRRILG